VKCNKNIKGYGQRNQIYKYLNDKYLFKKFWKERVLGRKSNKIELLRVIKRKTRLSVSLRTISFGRKGQKRRTRENSRNEEHNFGFQKTI